jgi:hypothetical protein
MDCSRFTKDASVVRQELGFELSRSLIREYTVNLPTPGIEHHIAKAQSLSVVFSTVNSCSTFQTQRNRKGL